MLIAIRARPGYAAVAGFVFGMVSDALTPASLGAGALANTLVGYLAAWGRAVFFPDNVLVNAGLFAAGVWVRNAIILLASGTPSAQLSSELVVLRDWFAIRLEA
jgi:rod shape-determining protein MreD